MKMKRIPDCIVHRDESGTVWFGENRPVRHPDDMDRLRQKCFGGTTWYMSSAVGPSDIARLLGHEDDAFGPTVGQIWGANFKTKRGVMKLLSAQCWGIDSPSPEECHDGIKDIFSSFISSDLKPRDSAAATAVGIWNDFYDGKKGNISLRQLPCRWRPLARAAMHQGPVSLLSGGAESAVHIDVRSAYLATLYDHVPVLGIRNGERVGGWVTDPEASWEALRNRMGFVEALVQVRSFGEGELPPLPVSHVVSGGIGVIYPTGILRGAWSIDQVRDAEERGECEVLKVFQSAFAPTTEPVFEEFSSFLCSLPKEMGKLLYTRFWGKLGSSGGYRAVRSPTPISGATPMNGLWWLDERYSPYDHQVRPTYRPDISAIVLARNQRLILEASRRLKRGSLVATHIDAIWTSDLEGAARLCQSGDRVGGWHAKEGPSPLRTYGIGVYQHGNRLKCSGLDQRREPLTLARVEDFARRPSSERRSVFASRVWSADPATSSEATSRPLEVDMSAHQPLATPDVSDARVWTAGGWATDAFKGPPHREVNGEERDLDVP